MTRRTHKQQHYIPQCYLKEWCDPNCPKGHTPFVWIFDKDGSNPKKRSPRNVFKEADFYTYIGEDNSRDLWLEQFLSVLEGRFVEIRESKLNQHLQLSTTEKTELLLFVAAMDFRTKESQDFHIKQWQSLEKRVDEMAKLIEKASPDELQRMCDITPISHDDSSPSTIDHDDVRELARWPLQKMFIPRLDVAVEIMSKMNMTIFVTNDATGFITTDSPVTLVDLRAQSRPPPFNSPALGSRTIEVTMPISPSQSLFISYDGTPLYVRTSRRALEEINRRHRFHCHENFVARTNIRSELLF